MPIIVEIVKPDITPEENAKRIKALEDTISILLKRKVTLNYREKQEGYPLDQVHSN